MAPDRPGPSAAPYVAVALAHTGLKILLVPAYRSTDFEVHRNWMSLTSRLSLAEWYTDDGSPWTLDYPPLFAAFERLIAAAAPLFDARMLDRDAIDYDSYPTVLFQRLTVMCADAVLYLGTYAVLRSREVGNGDEHTETDAHVSSARADVLLFALVVCDAGLLLVDHVHFQYNGLLLGMLFLSVAAVQTRRHLAAAAMFTLLLLMKHLYLFAAPLYFVYLLRVCCFAERTPSLGTFLRWPFARLGAVVVSISAAVITPFAHAERLSAVASRLFPFGKRGLTHTYWAPNTWALYNAVDCALVVGARLLRSAGVKEEWVLSTAAVPLAHTAGLVEPEPHAVLPCVTPAATACLTLALMVPVLAGVWARPDPRVFRKALACVSLVAFLTGWHVHEKAVLTGVLLVTISALDSLLDAHAAVLLIPPAHYSLLPLIFEPAEYWLKLLCCSTYALGFVLVCAVAMPNGDRLANCLSCGERTYLAALLPLEAFLSFSWPSLSGNRLPFLPLLLTSVYCALGIHRAAWAVFAGFLRPCRACAQVSADAITGGARFRGSYR